MTFRDLGLSPKILEILTHIGINVPTPIQSKSIPALLEGKDIVGIAQTGTGKTLAYGLPMLELLAKNKGRGLILLPTRELAIQVNEQMKQIGEKFGLRTAVLIGGEPKHFQLKSIRKNPHIIIATPGRLIDFLSQRAINFRDNKILVLDEADLMLDMGFQPQIKEILKSVPEDRQTMLFSATMPPAIMSIITHYMRLPVRIEVAPSGTPAEFVDHEMIVIAGEDKLSQTERVLRQFSGKVLIFARTKFGVKKLCRKLVQMNYNAEEIHSDRSLVQRNRALTNFKTGKARVLVATDIAARGIDVKEIELVLNYDLPDNSEDYIHRIGRTGRAGKSGKAISFALPSQAKDIRDIEKLIRKSIALTEIVKLAQDKSERKKGPSRNGGKFAGRNKRFGNRTSFGSKPSFGGRQRSSARPGFRSQGKSKFSNYKSKS